MYTESFADPELYELTAEEYVTLLKQDSESEKALTNVESSIEYIHEGHPIQLKYESLPTPQEDVDEMLYSAQVGQIAFSGKTTANTETGEYIQSLVEDKEELDEGFYPNSEDTFWEKGKDFLSGALNSL